jgi:hypothetical protein
MDADAHFIGRLTITQTGLVADLKSQDVLAVIYPRLKTQKPPVVTSLANGRAVKIEHEAGTDYVFQSDVPFTYKGDGIEFDGVSGVVKVRGGKAFVAVGEGGELTAFGQTKEGPIPDTVQSWARAKGKTLYNDFEDGKPPAFQKSVLNPQLYEGNPVAGDTTHDGKSAMVLTLPAGRGGSASYYSPISIDPAKKYRLSLKMYAPEKVNVTVGGHQPATEESRWQRMGLGRWLPGSGGQLDDGGSHVRPARLRREIYFPAGHDFDQPRVLVRRDAFTDLCGRPFAGRGKVSRRPPMSGECARVFAGGRGAHRRRTAG